MIMPEGSRGMGGTMGDRMAGAMASSMAGAMDGDGGSVMGDGIRYRMVA